MVYVDCRAQSEPIKIHACGLQVEETESQRWNGTSYDYRSPLDVTRERGGAERGRKSLT